MNQFSLTPFFKKMTHLVLGFSLALGPTSGYAQSSFVTALPEPGTMLNTSDSFVPVQVNGLVIHPDKPLNLEFIVDSGNDSQDLAFIKKQGERLAKYFLAAVTVPEKQLWVNLSPYEEDRIIENDLGQTDLGRDMLAQDYVLKQLAASLIYPEKGVGKEFWAKIYKEAKERFGTTDIPVDTFNKVWILPGKTEIFEKLPTKDTTDAAVYITQAGLKVMLDSDRTAMMENAAPDASDEKASLTKAIMRDIVIPAIEKEVNEGRNFATIRQVYHAAILAKWYRELVQNTIMNEVYVGKNRVAGAIADETDFREEIYQRYVAAFKKGVFDYVKDDPNGAAFSKKYFSGGVTLYDSAALARKTGPVVLPRVGAVSTVGVNMATVSSFTPKLPSVEKLMERIRTSLGKLAQPPVFKGQAITTENLGVISIGGLAPNLADLDAIFRVMAYNLASGTPLNPHQDLLLKISSVLFAEERQQIGPDTVANLGGPNPRPEDLAARDFDLISSLNSLGCYLTPTGLMSVGQPLTANAAALAQLNQLLSLPVMDENVMALAEDLTASLLNIKSMAAFVPAVPSAVIVSPSGALTSTALGAVMTAAASLGPNPVLALTSSQAASEPVTSWTAQHKDVPVELVAPGGRGGVLESVTTLGSSLQKNGIENALLLSGPLENLAASVSPRYLRLLAAVSQVVSSPLIIGRMLINYNNAAGILNIHLPTILPILSQNTGKVQPGALSELRGVQALLPVSQKALLFPALAAGKSPADEIVSVSSLIGPQKEAEAIFVDLDALLAQADQVIAEAVAQLASIAREGGKVGLFSRSFLVANRFSARIRDYVAIPSPQIKNTLSQGNTLERMYAFYIDSTTGMIRYYRLSVPEPGNEKAATALQLSVEETGVSPFEVSAQRFTGIAAIQQTGSMVIISGAAPPGAPVLTTQLQEADDNRQKSTGGVNILDIQMDHAAAGAKILFNEQPVRDALKNGFYGFSATITVVKPMPNPEILFAG